METLSADLPSLKQEILKRQQTLSQEKERVLTLQHENLSEVLPLFQSVKNEIFNCQNPDVALSDRTLKVSEEKGRTKEISALGLTVKFAVNENKNWAQSGEKLRMYFLKFPSVKDWEASLNPSIDDWRHIDTENPVDGVSDVEKAKDAIINHLANKLQPLTEAFPAPSKNELQADHPKIDPKTQAGRQ